MTDLQRYRPPPSWSDDELVQLKREVVRVAQAEQRIYLRMEDAEAHASRWRDRARFALEREDEPLARQALERAAAFTDRAQALREQFNELAVHLSELKGDLQRAQIATTVRPTATFDLDPLAVKFDRLEREAARERLDLELQAMKAALATNPEITRKE